MISRLKTIECFFLSHHGREGREEFCSRCGAMLTDIRKPLEPQEEIWNRKPRIMRDWQFFWSYIINVR